MTWHQIAGTCKPRARSEPKQGMPSDHEPASPKSKDFNATDRTKCRSGCANTGTQALSELFDQLVDDELENPLSTDLPRRSTR